MVRIFSSSRQQVKTIVRPKEYLMVSPLLGTAAALIIVRTEVIFVVGMIAEYN